jgi:hypothetical protein
MPPESLPVAILLGLYLGLIAGIVPALITGVLGFVFRYLSGITVPAFAVVVLAIAVAGVNGGFLALNEPTIRRSPTLVTAVLVVLMLGLAAHAQGDALGARLPRRLPWRALRERTIATDVIELVGARGQIRVSPVGEIADIEGAPPLPDTTREAIAEGEWTFPADLPLAAVEERLAERLRAEYDLDEVTVSIDERGRARISATPSTGTLSGRVPAGQRAVSVEALVPSGLARGDRVAVLADGARVAGTVVSARSGDPHVPVVPAPGEMPADADAGDTAADEPAAPAVERSTPAPTTTGGPGRVTVAVSREAANTLLTATAAAVVVESRGVRREFELLSLLRSVGVAIRRLRIGDGALADETLGAAGLRDRFGVAILAIDGDGGWRVAPGADTVLRSGAECFVVGPRASLDRFAEAIQ